MVIIIVVRINARRNVDFIFYYEATTLIYQIFTHWYRY